MTDAHQSPPIERPKNVPLSREIASDASALTKAEAVVAAIEQGTKLREALETQQLGRDIFAKSLSIVRPLAVRYARAMELSADFLVDDALAAVNNPDLEPMRARNIADMHRWAASKLNSKRYGDRIDLNVTQTMDVTSVISEMKARRLRPISDQLSFDDAQVIDVPTLPAPKTFDMESSYANQPDVFSDAAAPGDVDDTDIFS